MVLFDCSIDVKNVVLKNKLLYWLTFLQTQIGKNSPVILIGTMTDKLNLGKQKLETRYTEISKGNFVFYVFLFCF